MPASSLAMAGEQERPQALRRPSCGHARLEVSRPLVFLDEDTWRNLGRPAGGRGSESGSPSASGSGSVSANGSPMTKRRSSWLGPTSQGKSPDGKTARVSFYVSPPSLLRGRESEPTSLYDTSTNTSTSTGDGINMANSTAANLGSSATADSKRGAGGVEEEEKEEEVSIAEQRLSFFGSRQGSVSAGARPRERRRVSFEAHTSAGTLAGTESFSRAASGSSDENMDMDMDTGSTANGLFPSKGRCALAVQRATYLGSRQGSPSRGRRMVKFLSEGERLPSAADTDPRYAPGSISPCQLAEGSGDGSQLAEAQPATEAPRVSPSDMDQMRSLLLGSKYGTLSKGARIVRFVEDEAGKSANSNLYPSPLQTRPRGAAKLRALFQDPKSMEANGMAEAAAGTDASRGAGRGSGGRKGEECVLGFETREGAERMGACGAACDDGALVNELRMMVLGSRHGSPSRCERLTPEGPGGVLGEGPRGLGLGSSSQMPHSASESAGVEFSGGAPRSRSLKWPGSQSAKAMDVGGTVTVERAKTVHGCRGEN